MAQHNEASVEEILESIKKVIARDNRDGAAETRRRREPAPAEPEAVADESEDAEVAAEILDLAEMELADEGAAGETGLDSLIREEARSAMQENLAALATIAAPGARPQIVRSGETSLEGLTRELLRPMLAEWLEKNLPSMVEELVQAEIARIVGKRS